MVSLGALAQPRRRYMRLGALGGDSLARANQVVNALGEKWSRLQRDVTEAVQRGEADSSVLGEVDAVQTEIDALTEQIFEIEPAGLAPWLAWSQDIDRRLAALATRHAVALTAVRRIRTIRIGVGFLVAGGLAAGVGYAVWRNRKKSGRSRR